VLHDVPAQAVVECSDAWSDEDLREFPAAVGGYVDSALDDDNA
jgi:hypothetical protein